MVIERDGPKLIIENDLVHEIVIENRHRRKSSGESSGSSTDNDERSSCGTISKKHSPQLPQLLNQCPSRCFHRVNTTRPSNMASHSDYSDSSDESSDLEMFYGSRNNRNFDRREQCQEGIRNEEEMMVADYSEDDDDFNDADSNSEIDFDNEDDEADDVSAQMTIAIEMDQSSGDDDMSASSGGAENNVDLDFEDEEDDFDFDVEESGVHEYEVDDSLSDSSDVVSHRRSSFESVSSAEYLVASPVRFERSSPIFYPNQDDSVPQSLSERQTSVPAASQEASSPATSQASPVHVGTAHSSPQVSSDQSPSQDDGGVSPQASSNQSPPQGDGDRVDPSTSKLIKTENGLSEPSSSESQDKDTGDKGTCCICLDSPSNQVVVPCGHICLCQICKDHYILKEKNHKKKCPLCTSRYSMIIKCYN